MLDEVNRVMPGFNSGFEQIFGKSGLALAKHHQLKAEEAQYLANIETEMHNAQNIMRAQLPPKQTY